MPKDQIIIGCIAAGLSAVGLWSVDWLIGNTRKGGWLRERHGEKNARWILRGVFAVGFLFGVLLATNVIRPVSW